MFFKQNFLVFEESCAKFSILTLVPLKQEIEKRRKEQIQNESYVRCLSQQKVVWRAPRWIGAVQLFFFYIVWMLFENFDNRDQFFDKKHQPCIFFVREECLFQLEVFDVKVLLTFDCSVYGLYIMPFVN